MGRILGSTLESTRLADEARFRRVNWYLTAGIMASATMLGWGIDLEQAIVSMPGAAFLFVSISLLVVRND